MSGDESMAASETDTGNDPVDGSQSWHRHVPGPGAGATSASGRTHSQLQRADRRVLWHPFTQMQGWMAEDFPVITAAEGCWLLDADGRRYLDGVSSLWCSVHGHRVASIDEAIKDQLDRVAHSTLLGLGGEPSILLAEELLALAPGELSRVFFSDSGSSAVEVGLKMAFQYWRQREGDEGGTQRTRFLSMQNGYHGDTLGAVSVGGIDLFHQVFGPLLFEARHVPVPQGPVAADRKLDVDRCLHELGILLDTEGESFAALILEPGVQGAGGLVPYPEGFTKDVVEMARREGLLIIVDEVATGFGRSGELFACEKEEIEADILCLGKALSGGYLPLAATLTGERVFDGFTGQHDDNRTFFHGHTFTGNALACAAARASLALCRDEGFLPRARALGARIAEGLSGLVSEPHVLEVRRYGSMFGIELVERRGVLSREGRLNGVVPFDVSRRMGHQVALQARQRGVILRPLGDTVVLMPPLIMTDAQADQLVEATTASIRAATRMP